MYEQALLLTGLMQVLEGSVSALSFYWTLGAEIAQWVWRLGYGMNNQRIVVRFPVGEREFNLRQSIHSGSGTHPISLPMGTGELPSGLKRSGPEANHSSSSNRES
jgi:hypothetical protein